MTIDVNAAAGAADIDLESGPSGATSNVNFPLPGGLTVTARAPGPLSSGAPSSGTIATPYDSSLYDFTPSSASLSILDFSATTTSSTVHPQIALLPSSGHFADLIAYGSQDTLLATSESPFYVVFWDSTGATGPYGVSVQATPPAATSATNSGDDTMTGAIVAASLPFVLSGGNLTTSTSVNWVKVTTGSGDGGKTLTAQTLGNPATDVALTIFDNTGTNVLDSEETDGLVKAQVADVGPGTVYYVVFAAGYEFSSSHGAYDGLIRVE